MYIHDAIDNSYTVADGLSNVDKIGYIYATYDINYPITSSHPDSYLEYSLSGTDIQNYISGSDHFTYIGLRQNLDLILHQLGRFDYIAFKSMAERKIGKNILKIQGQTIGAGQVNVISSIRSDFDFNSPWITIEFSPRMAYFTANKQINNLNPNGRYWETDHIMVQGQVLGYVDSTGSHQIINPDGNIVLYNEHCGYTQASNPGYPANAVQKADILQQNGLLCFFTYVDRNVYNDFILAMGNIRRPMFNIIVFKQLMEVYNHPYFFSYGFLDMIKEMAKISAYHNIPRNFYPNIFGRDYAFYQEVCQSTGITYDINSGQYIVDSRFSDWYQRFQAVQNSLANFANYMPDLQNKIGSIQQLSLDISNYY